MCWRFGSSGIWCCVARQFPVLWSHYIPLKHQETPGATALHPRRLKSSTQFEISHSTPFYNSNAILSRQNSTLKALHSSNQQETLIQWQNITFHKAWIPNNNAVETSNLTFQNIFSAILHTVPQWSECSFSENSNLLFTCWVIPTVIQVDWHNILITLCSLYNHKYTLLMHFESEAPVACTVTNIHV